MRSQETPLQYLRQLRGEKHAFCLYSGKGRYSYVGANPLKVCKVYPNYLILGEKKVSYRGENPFSLLEKEFGLKNGDSEFLKSGWVGFWAYEISRFCDGSFPRRELADDFLLGWWGYYDSPRVWDHAQDKAIEEEPTFHFIPSFTFNDSEYVSAVERILRYIQAGDCYQVNLAQIAKAPLPENFDACEAFTSLALRHPSAFSAYLDCGSKQIISLSPEELLWMQGSQLRTSPIKGTRRRGANPREDEFIRQELEASEKEKAELLMIVDLERNDLGKICEAGSVKVTALRNIMSLDYVFHAYAVVKGLAKPGLSALEATQALFPGGSITGAPKKRAMEIIQELESSPRGVYTGAIGFYDMAGLCHLNIAIRSLEIEGNFARLGMGGGIVADSQAPAEFQELLAKAKSFGSEKT